LEIPHQPVVTSRTAYLKLQKLQRSQSELNHCYYKSLSTSSTMYFICLFFFHYYLCNAMAEVLICSYLRIDGVMSFSPGGP